jgi:hypothetical protein
MRRWLDPGWYRYLTSRYPDRVAVAAVFMLGLLAFGGYAAVGAMGGGNVPATGAFVPLTTTVMRTVKAYQQGHIVVKRVAIVKRVAVLRTQTLRGPTNTTVVTTPVYRVHTVRVGGKVVTVRSVVTNTKVLTNVRTAVRTDTQLATITNERTNTVVQNQTQIQTQTQTAVVTRTATGPTQTVTATGPGETVTVTNRVTSTVTSPPDTVTVTVTTTKSG